MPVAIIRRLWDWIPYLGDAPFFINRGATMLAGRDIDVATTDFLNEDRRYRAVWSSTYYVIDPDAQYAELHRLGADGRYASPDLIAPQEALTLALLPDWRPTPGELFGWPPADLSLDEDMPAAP